jgi:tRNA pseudouridine55 synthase
VGHAGTLDPLATGVLLVCIGAACKRAQEFQDHDKEYVAGIRFGATTPSYDLEKEVDRTFPYEHITEEAVREALKGFLGPQEQIAPLFSAKSVDGVRAYELARKLYRKSQRGDLDPDFDAAALETLHRSRITISDLELLGFDSASASGVLVREGSADKARSSASSRINVADTSGMGLPTATVRIACSKGTYIRALARDLGEALGSGAHLSSLVRTRTGELSLENALSLEETLLLLSD